MYLLSFLVSFKYNSNWSIEVLIVVFSIIQIEGFNPIQSNSNSNSSGIRENYSDLCDH